MTKKEKQLLFKDLCARLPYGVMIYLHTSSDRGSTILLNSDIYGFIEDVLNNSPYEIKEIKPYLRPMSSMTEEEKNEVVKLGVCYDGAFHNDVYDVGTSMEDAFLAISWFLERHFDINYLIKKGLALEAPEDMYKTE